MIEPFSTSDHCQVKFSIFSDCTNHIEELVTKRYDWSTADYDGMSEYIAGIDWLDILTTHTADCLWAAFSEVLQAAIDVCVPVKYVRNNANVKCKRWYPAALRRAISRKRCLWRMKRESPDNTDLFAAYRDAEHKCRYLMQQYEMKREQNVIECNNAGTFFNFINNKLLCKRGLGALKNDNGDLITDDGDRANLLNDYFASMGTSDNGIIPDLERVVPEKSNLENIEFTSDNIYAAIRKLRLNGASGPDGFPLRLFKTLASCLSAPLSLLFSSFMSIGKVPQNWKHAVVTPVYKNGSASCVSNYRPISLTCVACNLMERVIVKKTLNFL